MYETDLLMCIVFILLCAYVRNIVRDFLKHRNQFWNIKGPKSLPITLIAYLFTARSDAGKVPAESISSAIQSVTIFLFQIAFKYCKAYRRNIRVFTPYGSAQNISLSLTIQPSPNDSSHIQNVLRKTFSWNFLDFPTDWLRWNVSRIWGYFYGKRFNLVKWRETRLWFICIDLFNYFERNIWVKAWVDFWDKFYCRIFLKCGHWVVLN